MRVYVSLPVWKKGMSSSSETIKEVGAYLQNEVVDRALTIEVFMSPLTDVLLLPTGWRIFKDCVDDFNEAMDQGITVISSLEQLDCLIYANREDSA